MKEAFEKIIDELKQESIIVDDDAGHRAVEIIHQIAEEYSYLSKGFDSGFLKRIADYFSFVYEGDDRTAPKMEFSVEELRDMVSLHVEKCRLQKEVDNLQKNQI